MNFLLKFLNLLTDKRDTLTYQKWRIGGILQILSYGGKGEGPVELAGLGRKSGVEDNHLSLIETLMVTSSKLKLEGEREALYVDFSFPETNCIVASRERLTGFNFAPGIGDKQKIHELFISNLLKRFGKGRLSQVQVSFCWLIGSGEDEFALPPALALGGINLEVKTKVYKKQFRPDPVDSFFISCLYDDWLDGITPDKGNFNLPFLLSSSLL